MFLREAQRVTAIGNLADYEASYFTLYFCLSVSSSWVHLPSRERDDVSPGSCKYRGVGVGVSLVR